jgi:WD40 repeat protein
MGAALSMAESRRAPTEVAALPTPSQAIWFMPARSGSAAVALCQNGALLLWSLSDGRLQHSIDTQIREFDVAAVSSDGRYCAIADFNGTYAVWNLASGTLHAKWRLPRFADALAFSTDGRRLAFSPAGVPAQILDLTTRRTLFELQGPVRGTVEIAFSRDNRYVATGDADTAVRVYDASNGTLRARNTDFLLEPFAVDFSADGRRLVAGGADKAVATLDAATGQRSGVPVRVVEPIFYLYVSADGTRVAVLLGDPANTLLPAPVLILDMTSGGRLSEWMPPSVVLGGGWTRAGEFLAGTATAKSLHIWRIQ